MLLVPFTGQFGNQLFQYCLGRIVAARTGLTYQPGLEWLTKSRRPVTWKGPRFLPTPRGVRGKTLPGTAQTIKTAHWLDLESIRSDRPVRLLGWFQRYELYKPWKSQIRTEWLPLLREFPATDPDAVYIHVRRTDYVGDHLSPLKHCQATTIDDYAAALLSFSGISKLVLLSDNYQDPILDEFSKFGFPVERANGTWDEDFMLLASCRQMIMSQSTYSWWAGFLGRAEKIVCPMVRDCYWGRGVDLLGAPPSGDYPNLYVDDEPNRWQWVVR